LNAWLGFLDESAFSQRPPVRATWAPKGQTPCLREPFNWQRLSGIGLVLTTPSARRLRWFLTFHPGGIRSPHLVRFFAALRRHRRRRVILLWDRLPAHRSGLTLNALQQHRRWLSVEWLPAYAPELNPIEPLWAYLDRTTLANTPHDNLRRLRRRVRVGLAHVQHHARVGRGFLKYTQLF
jgi:transposase